MTFRTILAAGLISAGAALAANAQDTVVVPSQQDTVVITPEQEVEIQEYVRAQPVQPVERPSNFKLVLGAIVPDFLKPGELSENVLPDQRYQYVVVDGQTALVEPQTRRVVKIIN